MPIYSYLIVKCATYFYILQILQVSSPPKSQNVSEIRVTDSDEVSDSDDSDSDQPLISVISSAHRRQSQPITAKDFQESFHAESPPLPEISNDDFADIDTYLSIGQEMVRRAMSRLEKTNDVSC